MARIFALVALLCAGVLQIQEAGHDHWHSLDDSYSQCLVCKATAAVLPTSAPVTQFPGNGHTNEWVTSPTSLASYHAPFQARGPPVYS